MERFIPSLYPSHKVSNDRGVVLTLFAILIPVLIGIVALVVDLTRQQIIASQLQNMTDAASSAATRELDGTLIGWNRAQAAALAVLQNYRLFGADSSLQGLVFSSSNNSSPEARAGNTVISLDRGIYMLKQPDGETKEEDIGKQSFQSFEAGSYRYGGAPAFSVANSVRVYARLENVKSTFGRVISGDTMGNLERESTVIADGDDEECVLPVAIPLCQLMLNTNPHDQGNYTNEYDANQQCQRDVIAIEANHEVSQRLDGLERYDSYYRPPLFPPNISASSAPPSPAPFNACGDDPPKNANGQFINCKALGLRAVLGVPEDPNSGTATEPSTPKAVADAIITNWGAQASQRGCIKTKRGARFRVLHSTADGQGSALSGGGGTFLENSSLKETLVKMIEGDPDKTEDKDIKNFRDIFYANNKLASNYPLPRRADIQPENQLRWPAIINNKLQSLTARYVGAQNEAQYTNPFCHTIGITRDDPGSAKAREVKLMVIAPSSPSIDYCDFDRLFDADNNYKPTLPTQETKPVVLGFVRAYLYDFQIEKLADDAVNNAFKKPPILAGLELREDYQKFINNEESDEGNDVQETIDGLVDDWKKQQQRISRSLDKYRQDYGAWARCMGCKPCGTTNETGCRNDCEPDCGAAPAYPRSWIEDVRLDSTREQVKKIREDFVNKTLASSDQGFRDCFEDPKEEVKKTFALDGIISWVNELLGCDAGSYCSPADKPSSFFFKGVENDIENVPELLKMMEYTPANTCLPVRRNDCLDVTDPNCWELRPREAQYGCGGLRLRLRCGDKQVESLISSKPLSRRSPILVN